MLQGVALTYYTIPISLYKDDSFSHVTKKKKVKYYIACYTASVLLFLCVCVGNMYLQRTATDMTHSIHN